MEEKKEPTYTWHGRPISFWGEPGRWEAEMTIDGFVFTALVGDKSAGSNALTMVLVNNARGYYVDRAKIGISRAEENFEIAQKRQRIAENLNKIFGFSLGEKK